MKFPFFLSLFAATLTFAEPIEVIIIGNIGSPGKYVIEKDEGVLDLVVKAGGIEPEGKALAIKREAENGAEVYRVNPSEIIESERDISLESGDMIFALSMSFEGLWGDELKEYNQRIIDFTKRDPKLFVNFEDLVEQDGAEQPDNHPEKP